MSTSQGDYVLDYDDVDTWFCFDCGSHDTESSYLDGYIRCNACTAKWEAAHRERNGGVDYEQWCYKR